MKQVLMLSLFCAALSPLFGQKNINADIKVNDQKREYIIHLPTNYSESTKLPLVMIFHGGGGNAKQMQGFYGMDEIADAENFICVYPQGINKQWNDGREFKESISANDDVLFINNMLDSIIKHYAVNTKRIFSTGISNGAFFSIYLSYKISDRILAVAPVCGSIPEKIFAEFTPAMPISVMLINGTRDPLVPYNGGSVGNRLIGSRAIVHQLIKPLKDTSASTKSTQHLLLLIFRTWIIAMGVRLRSTVITLEQIKQKLSW